MAELQSLPLRLHFLPTAEAGRVQNVKTALWLTRAWISCAENVIFFSSLEHFFLAL